MSAGERRVAGAIVRSCEASAERAASILMGIGLERADAVLNASSVHWHWGPNPSRCVPTVQGRPWARLLRAFSAATGASGAAASLVSGRGHVGVLAYTDEGSCAIDELHFSLGEGPALDAYRSGASVISNDPGSASERWPAFGSTARERGICSFFSVVSDHRPHLGVVTTFYAARRLRPLDDQVLRCFLAATERLVVQTAGGTTGLDLSVFEAIWNRRAGVHRATGVLMGRLDTDPSTALELLRLQAWTEDRSLEEVSARVLRDPDGVDRGG